MPKILMMLFIFASVKSFAIDTKLVSTGDSACTVRLSNNRIESEFHTGNSELGFCSGTLLGPGLVATAAHCLNEAVEGQVKNLKDGKGFDLNMAVGAALTSSVIEVLPGAVYSDLMATERQREKFITEGDITLVAHDVVLLKLKSPVAGVDSASCPQLPTAAECAEALADKDPASFSAHFYTSRYYEQGGGASKQKYSYPIAHGIGLTATHLSRSDKGYAVLQFNSATESALLEKGDSGTGLIWSKEGKNILIGVQSATSGSDHNRAFFADLCALVGSANWP